MPRLFLITLLCTALFLPACASQRIELAEQLGYAKREQLVDKVKAARDGQQEAKQQFASALEEFLAVTGVGANASVRELESRYANLKREYERSEAAADEVRSRIKSVQRVAAALFREWKAELNEYTSPTLRAASERQLADTQAQYDRLLGAMRTAEQRMTPVLGAFKDQVLFLKHNLNARAIASLQDSAGQIQSDVERLIQEMEASIAEADRFVRELGVAER